MTENEILLRIRTALEAGGLDAARSGLSDLTKQIENATTATTEQTAAEREAQKVTDNLTRLIVGLRGTMAGSAQGAQMLATSLRSIIPAAAGAGGVVAAFIGGWKLGGLLDQTLGLSKGVGNLTNELTKVELAGRLSSQEVAKLGASNLDALKSAIASVNKDLDALLAKAQRGIARDKAEADAEAAAAEDIAGPGQTAEQARNRALRAGSKRIGAIELDRTQIEFERQSAQEKRAALQGQLSAVETEAAQKQAAAQAAQAAIAAKERSTPQLNRANRLALGGIQSAAAFFGAQGIYENASGALEGQVSDAERSAAVNAAKLANEARNRAAAAREQIGPQLGALDETLTQDLPSRERILDRRSAGSLAVLERDLAGAETLARKESDTKRLSDTEAELARTQERLKEAQARLATEQTQATAAAADAQSLAALAGQRNAPGALTARRQLPGIAARAESEALDVRDAEAAIADLQNLFRTLTAAVTEMKATAAAYRP